MRELQKMDDGATGAPAAAENDAAVAAAARGTQPRARPSAHTHARTHARAHACARTRAHLDEAEQRRDDDRHARVQQRGHGVAEALAAARRHHDEDVAPRLRQRRLDRLGLAAAKVSEADDAAQTVERLLARRQRAGRARAQREEGRRRGGGRGR